MEKTNDIYRGKRIWLTGDTGFKGSWLAFWLRRLGAEVWGIGLEPETEEGLFTRAALGGVIRHETVDIRDGAKMAAMAREFAPEVVFHLAAQALVRRSYADPVETFDTNVRGAAKVLDAVRRAGNPCAVVVVTSDKCYENREGDYAYREGDPMGGHDPYSASKGCEELVAASFRSAFFAPGKKIHLATARAGNVIGPGDWAADRIVPDAVRAIRAGSKLSVRNPRAVRPWQHVLEPLSGYLRLGQVLMEQGVDGRWFEFRARFSIGCICYDHEHVRRMGGRLPPHDEPEWCAWIVDHDQTCVLDQSLIVHHYSFFIQQEWLDRTSLLEDLRAANMPETIRVRSLSQYYGPRWVRMARQIPGIVKRRMGVQA